MPNLKKKVEPNSLESPTGHHFVVGAHLQDTKYGKSKLYWCQYKPRTAEEGVDVEMSAQPVRKDKPLLLKHKQQSFKPADEKNLRRGDSPSSGLEIIDAALDKEGKRSRADELFDDKGMSGKKRPGVQGQRNV